MPSQWDHKADKDLLLTIIEDGNLTHINWHSVSAKLQSKDYTFSHEACRQHYQKIRKESRNNATSNSTASVSTPTKAIASVKSTPASKRKNTKPFNSSSNSNEDDEENMEATPSAKRKRNEKKEKPEPQDMGGFAGQTAAQFKVEEFGVNGDTYCSPVDLVDEGIYAV